LYVQRDGAIDYELPTGVSLKNHNPLVGGSNPSAATNDKHLKYRGNSQKKRPEKAAFFVPSAFPNKTTKITRNQSLTKLY
jgi:hypothetical protein